MLLNIFLFQVGNVASFRCYALWCFLPFLLGLLIGYWIWGAYKAMVAERDAKIQRLNKTISDNEKEAIDLKYKLESADSLTTKLKSSFSECQSENSSLNRKLRLAEAAAIPAVTEEIVEETPLAIVAEPEEELVVEEIVEETIEETPPVQKAAVAAAATAVAVKAASPSNEDDKEDDYLPCKEYLGHAVNDKRNNVAFFKHSNGQYYFALYAADGSVRLRSEGFSKAQLRDKELSGVVRFKDNPEMYKRVQKGKYYMDVLFDETGREVGRSCLQKEIEVEATAPEVAPKEAEAPAQEVAKKQTITVKRTVNISGLEDLDGIDASAQSKLMGLGFGSMTALAAASETDLASRFAGSGLNWRHWWNQSKYATNGDWAKFYALQNSKNTVAPIEVEPEEVAEVTAPVTPVEVPAAPIQAVASVKSVSKKNQYQIYFSNDNLQIIEGVGPKIEKILKEAGYNTWGILANASFNDLKKVMSDAGPRYRIHNPKSWSKQAQLANDNKWEELINYQKFLENTIGTDSAYSKVEKLLNKNLGFSNSELNDLKIIEGIGPKIEGLLKAGGINTWKDLSNASVDKLKLILLNAGNRYRLADPSTWPIQAGMANRREWTKLKEYQDLLQGGKRIS